MTKDQTVYQWCHDTNNLDNLENINKNEITSAFGCGSEKALNLVIEEVVNMKELLFTTDGIREYVSLGHMEKIINNKNMSYQEKLEKLTKKSIENGSQDDVSILFVSF